MEWIFSTKMGMRLWNSSLPASFAIPKRKRGCRVIINFIKQEKELGRNQNEWTMIILHQVTLWNLELEYEYSNILLNLISQLLLMNVYSRIVKKDYCIKLLIPPSFKTEWCKRDYCTNLIEIFFFLCSIFNHFNILKNLQMLLSYLY